MEKNMVALFRGINVSGNNLVSMSSLKDIFKELGFYEVISYINSGNIIFKSPNNNTIDVKKSIEDKILKELSLTIKVAVFTKEEYEKMIQNAPIWWGANKKSKHNAIFIIPPFDPKKVINEVGAINDLYEQVGYQDNVIFWSAPIETFSKTKWSRINTLSIYNCITIRNYNTSIKILELLNN